MPSDLNYVAPTREMLFVIDRLAGFDEIARLPGYENATRDMVEAVLAQAGRFSCEVLAPLNKTGDEQGSRLVAGAVVVPDGFSAAYQTYVECGWPALKHDTGLGGQGFPNLVGAAVMEMANSANMSFSLLPMLIEGAVEALKSHASESVKARFLPKMVSGEWAATMNLTEPQAGSDLAAVQARAEPRGDHYRIAGQKIFITWGDHEMSGNVIHLVLARLPDAPAGVRGISLFVVPKFLLRNDGSLGERNDVHVVSLERKLGLHASPTCTMSFGDTGGAVGYLVGEPNNGLACMFTMMNHARLGVAVQGVAIAERAYQQAAGYARHRVQGQAPGHEGRVAIVHHADVRRMLMLMRAQIEAMRSLTYVTAAALDRSHRSEDPRQRAENQARMQLLTPVVKAWCTEVAQEVTTLAIQVHGGTGFIEDTGAAQYFRDARITTIYEGTTGVQAGDFVGRKLLRDDGAAMRSLLQELSTFVTATDVDNDRIADLLHRLEQRHRELAETTEWVLEQSASDQRLLGAVSVNYLMLTGVVLGGWQMVRAAVIAQRELDAGAADTRFWQSKIALARFYVQQIMPRASAYREAVLAGAENIMELPADCL